MRDPAEGVDSFVDLFESTPVSEINEQGRAAWGDVAGMLSRMDRASKQVELAYSEMAVQEVRFRKRDYKDAVVSIGGCWFSGYVFARQVYGTVLVANFYSETDEAVSHNGQRLIDFAESIDVEMVVANFAGLFADLPEALASFREKLLDATENGAARKLRARKVDATLSSAWAAGITAGIAEHEIFLPG
jgi:hypothetical protein